MRRGKYFHNTNMDLVTLWQPMLKHDCRSADVAWRLTGRTPYLSDGGGRQGVVLKVRKLGRPVWAQLPDEHLEQGSTH